MMKSKAPTKNMPLPLGNKGNLPALSGLVFAKEDEPYIASLAGYWDFDEWNDTYMLDRTINANHGLVAGANKSYGKSGWGMAFDGVDDYVNISANSFSNASTSGPLMNAVLSMTLLIALSISSFIEIYWAFRSAKGIFILCK